MKIDRTLTIVLTLAIAVNFANIGGLDIYALDEAKNAEAARIMFETSDYVVPYYNGELRGDKPPLHYYFMSIGYKLFGVNAYGARFMSSIFGVLTVLLVYLFGQKYFDKKTALYASLVLISSFHFNVQMHMSVPDPYLIFFLTWAFFAFYNAYSTNSLLSKLSFYFAIGCGFLLKGPIAIGLPGITAVLFLLFNKDLKWKTIWRLQPFGGLILSAAVVLPWFLAVDGATNGVWTEMFFVKHNFSRYTEAMEGHDGIFLISFFYAFVLGMLSFVAFVFQSYKKAYKERKQNEPLFYALIAGLVIVVFFASSSTKLPNYTTPSYPLSALILGYYITRIKDDWFHSLGNRIGYYFYAILMLILPFGLYFGLQGDENFGEFYVLGMYFLPLTILGIYMLYVGKKRQGLINVIHGIIMSWTVIILMFFHVIFPQVDETHPPRRLIPQMDTQAHIVSYVSLNPAFVYALKRDIPKYNSVEELKVMMTKYPKGYIISRKRHLEVLQQIPGLVYIDEAKDTFEKPSSLLMRWGN